MAAPKGNQYALGNDGGRPMKYNPEQLEAKFNGYIADCIENGKLANVIGFSIYADMDKETYYNYKDREEFFATIKRIESLLEDISIQEAFKAKNAAFLIFYLKNKFGYKDKTEVETTIKESIKEKTTAELEAELKELEDKK